MAILNSKQLKSLIIDCKMIVEEAYKSKLEENFGGDEYFKRGFLLACRELTEVFLNKLNEFTITHRVKNEE